MINYTIDNTDRGDIDRTILWQYDNATHLIGVINILKDFFKQAVTDFWGNHAKVTNLVTPEDVDAFGLAIWGKILNVSRIVSIDGSSSDSVGEFIELSDALYRRLLVARFRLLDSNASLKAYAEYIYTVFQGKVCVVDNGDMALSLEVNSGAGALTEEELALVDSPDITLEYPAGVKSAEHSDSLIFGLSESNSAPQDAICGGLDDSSFYWGYPLLTNEGDSSSD